MSNPIPESVEQLARVVGPDGDDALNPDEEPTEYEMREYVEAVLTGESVDAEDKPSRGCSIKWKAGNEPEYFNV